MKDQPQNKVILDGQWVTADPEVVRKLRSLNSDLNHFRLTAENYLAAKNRYVALLNSGTPFQKFVAARKMMKHEHDLIELISQGNFIVR